MVKGEGSRRVNDRLEVRVAERRRWVVFLNSFQFKLKITGSKFFDLLKANRVQSREF